jgi:hypothetical protein
MRDNYVPATVYRNYDPGFRRLVAAAKHLSPIQIIVQLVGLLVSTAIGVGGAGIGVWLIFTVVQKGLVAGGEYGLASGFVFSLGTGVWIVGVALVSFLWLMSVAVAWPTEDNDLARALYGVPM